MQAETYHTILDFITQPWELRFSSFSNGLFSGYEGLLYPSCLAVSIRETGNFKYSDSILIKLATI